MFFQKAASRLVTFLFNVQESAPYVATGLINPYPANVENMVTS